MKIESYQTNNLEEMDEWVNKQDEEKLVKATHTHHVHVGNKEIMHFATIFYLPTKSAVEKPATVGYKITKG